MMLACLVLAALALLYGPHVLHGGFVYEDARWLSVPVQFGPRGLTQASWALTSTPQAAHALSLLMHIVVSALLGLFACRLGMSVLAGVLTASLCALHPVTVESVAYAASRGELIAALGILLACLAALRTDMWRWPLVFCGLLVGLGGKETALVAMGLIPLTLWVTWRRWRVAAFVSASLASLALVLNWTRLQGLSNDIQGWTANAPDWLLAQAAATYRLIGLTLVPVGMTVDADIDFYTHGFRLAAVVALTGLAGLAWMVRQTQPRVSFGLAWCLLAILPRLLVQTPRSYLNEHQFYVPLMGLLLAGMAWWDSTQQVARG